MVIDPALKIMMQIAELGGPSGATLFVGGQVVQGDLISTAEYLSMLEEFAKFDGKSNPLSDTFKESSEGAGQLGVEEGLEPRFVHLKNVRVMGESSLQFPSNVPAAFSLEAIGGWSPGRLMESA